MKTSQAGIDLIKKYEGCRLKAYILPGEKYYSIGYGHSGADVLPNSTISQEEAENLLRMDLTTRERYVEQYAKIPLNVEINDALVSYCYNRGVGKFRDYCSASKTIEDYCENIVIMWGSAQKYKEALMKRRREEQALFRKGMEKLKAGGQSMRIGHASIDENGSTRGGQAGDQGKEVCIRQWYNKGWSVLLRAKDEKIAERMASACESCCSNSNIGYDQNQRNTLHDEARAVGYDLTKLRTLCETDCSAFMTLCAIAAGVDALEYTGNAPTTRTMTTEFGKTGKFLCYTDPKYLKGIEYLKRGDILVAPGSHTVMVLDNGPRIKDDIEFVAREVLRGKYGNGAERKAALKAAGHNPAAVQAMVNRLVSSAT